MLTFPVNYFSAFISEVVLAVVVIAFVGWVGNEVNDAPASLTPIVVSTPTAVASASVSAAPLSPDPGPATLASGADVQNGKRGYVYWCANDVLDTCGIFDRYGGPIPFEMLHVPSVGALAFTYHGAEPIIAITSLVYSLAGAGSDAYPTLRGGIPLPTTQTDRQATIAAPAASGGYVIIVHISGEKNTTADSQFHILVG